MGINSRVEGTLIAGEEGNFMGLPRLLGKESLSKIAATAGDPDEGDETITSKEGEGAQGIGLRYFLFYWPSSAMNARGKMFRTKKGRPNNISIRRPSKKTQQTGHALDPPSNLTQLDLDTPIIDLHALSHLSDLEEGTSVHQTPPSGAHTPNNSTLKQHLVPEDRTTEF